MDPVLGFCKQLKAQGNFMKNEIKVLLVSLIFLSRFQDDVSSIKYMSALNQTYFI